MNSLEKALAIKEMDRVACGTAGVVTTPLGAILMIRRSGGHGAGTWSVPGGWVDAGEDPAEAVVRELREEVGIEADPEQVIFMTYTFDQHDEGIEDVCLWFRVLGWEGEPRICEPEKVDSIGWYSPDELPQPLFSPTASLVGTGVRL